METWQVCQCRDDPRRLGGRGPGFRATSNVRLYVVALLATGTATPTPLRIWDIWHLAKTGGNSHCCLDLGHKSHAVPLKATQTSYCSCSRSKRSGPDARPPRSNTSTRSARAMPWRACARDLLVDPVLRAKCLSRLVPTKRARSALLYREALRLAPSLATSHVPGRLPRPRPRRPRRDNRSRAITGVGWSRRCRQRHGLAPFVD